MALSVLAFDGRPVAQPVPTLDDVRDADSLLSFLILAIPGPTSAEQLIVQSTDARGAVEATATIVIDENAPVSSTGEFIAWVEPATESDRRAARQARERLVLSARHDVERREFEATGELPPESASPRVFPHSDRVAKAAERAAAGPHDAASDTRAAGQLAHDLLDEYRPLSSRHDGVAGIVESHLADHYEVVAGASRRTVDERGIAATLALAQRVAALTEVIRTQGGDLTTSVADVVAKVDELVGWVADDVERRHGAGRSVPWSRRTWRRMGGR